MPILVSVERKSGWLGAWVVPEKGEHWRAIRVLFGNLEELGYEQVIARSGLAPAMARLKKAVKRELGEDMTYEVAPVSESNSLGQPTYRSKYCRGEYEHSGTHWKADTGSEWTGPV